MLHHQGRSEFPKDVSKWLNARLSVPTSLLSGHLKHLGMSPSKARCAGTFKRMETSPSAHRAGWRAISMQVKRHYAVTWKGPFGLTRSSSALRVTSKETLCTRG